MALTPWTQTDFSGGMTDAILGAGPRQAQKLENFLISAIEKKPVMRAGSEIYDAKIVAQIQISGWVNDLVNFAEETALLIRQYDQISVRPVSDWLTIQGPAGNDVFYGAIGSSNSQMTYGENNQILYCSVYDSTVTPTLFVAPQKIFRDVAGTFKVLNAGLPKFPDGTDATNRASLLASAITYANGLRSALIQHFAHTTDAVTITTGTPGTITCAAHGLRNGDQVTFSATVAPTGLTTTDSYYVKSVTTNTFQVATTRGGTALAITTTGTAVALRNHAAAHTFSFAAVATDEASLLTLTKSLWTAVSNHSGDGRGGLTYHSVTARSAMGSFYPRPYVTLETLFDCVPVLNELRRVFNLHCNAFFTNYNGRIHTGKRVDKYTATDLSLSASTATFTPIAPVELLYTMLDAMRTSWNTHIDDIAGANGHTTADSAALGDSRYVVPSAPADFTDFVSELLLLYNGYILHRTDNSVHGGTESATTAVSTALIYNSFYQDTTHSGWNYIWDPSSADDWNVIFAVMKDLVTVINLHAAQTPRHLAAGGAFSPSTSFTTFTVTETSYAFTYANRYSVEGGFAFEDVSAPAYVSSGPYCSSIAGGGPFFLYSDTTYHVSIGNLPALDNSQNHPFDTVVKQIWRTQDGGNVYYKVTEADNSVYTGTPGFYDGIADSELSSQTLYTTGGVVSNDPPPKCTGFWIVGNRAFYGGTVEIVKGAEVHYPKRIRQSIADDLDSSPETFYVDLPSDFVCGGSAGGKPIVVTKRGVFRLEGGFDELGQGALTWDAISDTVGGVSVTGGVTLDDVYYFAGTDGFYMTDGYRVVPISTHLKKTTYPALVATTTQRISIQCKLDRTRRRVYWTAARAGGVQDCCFVLDLNHPIVDEQACFTVLANVDGLGNVQFSPTAIEFYGGVLVRGDYQGFVFKHTDGLTYDPKINRSGSGTLTGDKLYIPWWYRSAAQDFGSDVRKWITEADFTFRNTGNLSVQPRSINDLNESNIRDMNPIRFRQTYAGNIEASRKFPASGSGTRGGFRAKQKQIELKPASVITASSTTLGTASPTAGNHLVLDTASAWPADCEDWQIGFFQDGFVPVATVVDRVSSDTLLLDVDLVALGYGANLDWQLKGVPKDESVEILAVSMYYQALSDRALESSTGVTGA